MVGPLVALLLTPLLLVTSLLSLPALPQLHVSDAPAQDGGRILYLQYCASCHGFKGDGKGTVKVTPPPRNFRDGKFSFGSTVDAIAKTIGAGIPGTQMLPFNETLTGNQRRAIAKFVIEFLYQVYGDVGDELLVGVGQGLALADEDPTIPDAVNELVGAPEPRARLLAGYSATLRAAYGEERAEELLAGLPKEWRE